MERLPKEVLRDIQKRIDRFNETAEEGIMEEILSDYACLFDMIGTYFFLTSNPYNTYFSTLEKKADFSLADRTKIKIEENGDSVFFYQPFLLATLSLEEILRLIIYQIEYVHSPLPLLYGKQEYRNMPNLKDGILKQLYEQYRIWNNVLFPSGKETFLEQKLSEIENLAKSEGNFTSRAFYQAVRMEKKGLSLCDDVSSCFSLDSMEGIKESEQKKVLTMFIEKSKSLQTGEKRGEKTGEQKEEILPKKTKAISWERELRNIIGGIPYGKRHTHMRLNRRQPLRSDLSGTLSDRRADLVVAIDTSYSMDKEMVEKALSQIMKLKTSLRFTMTLIQCDSSIQEVRKIRTVKDIPTLVKGRGGTAFSPVIDYLNEHKEYHDAILIYFTDGFGERSIPKPLVKKVLWVIIGRKTRISLNQPYGIVLPAENCSEEK